MVTQVDAELHQSVGTRDLRDRCDGPHANVDLLQVRDGNSWLYRSNLHAEDCKASGFALTFPLPTGKLHHFNDFARLFGCLLKRQEAGARAFELKRTSSNPQCP